jgi:cytoskeletal protein CcmA (bactofilin family)
MKDERGQLTGDIVVSEPYTLWGRVAGNVTVQNGGKFYLRGSIFGDLTVEPGGRVHLLGNLQGKLTVQAKAKAVVGGMVGGDVVNLGGRIYVEQTATVMGKVKTKDGETVVEPKPK